MSKQLIKTEQIGNVPVKYLQAKAENAPVYSDGAGENLLYTRFKNNPNYGKDNKNGQFGSWVEEYHLSTVRHNLLKWLPFDPESEVLEIGAGCGALTGLLCQKVRSVTALEYSKQRALITAMRHSQCTNLEVIVGGLQDFTCEKEYDYITVIGVLEYAATFYGIENPYKSFLTKVQGMLKKSGALILAIENKIGLKYLCGAQEDHTGRVFDSIYDYPYPSKARTFSKKELTSIFQDAGFCHLEWYYPLPDYKMPQEVMSEKTIPKDLDSVWRLFPARTGRRPRREIISEKRLAKTLTHAGLFGEFANSFLAVARMKKTHEKSQCLRFIGANTKRKSKFRTNKQIWRQDKEKLFVLSADNDESVKFLRDIVSKEDTLKKFFGDNAKVITGELNGNRLIYPYINFPSLAELIGESIKNDDDVKFGRSWIDTYIKFLHKLPAKKCVPKEFMRELGIVDYEICEPIHCLDIGIVDCVPHNILVDDNSKKWCIIDNEFTYELVMPIDFLICRAIRTLVVDLQNQIQSHVCNRKSVILFSGHGANRHYIPSAWFKVLTSLEISLKQQAHWCAAFQNKVVHYKYKPHGRLKTTHRILTHVPIADLITNQRITDKVYRILRAIKRRL